LKKQLLINLFLVFFILGLVYLVLFSLQHGNALVYWKLLSFSLFLFLVPLTLDFFWIQASWTIALIGGVFLSATFLSFWATGSLYFLIPALAYLIVSVGFFRLHRHAVGELLTAELEIEKNLTRQNELQNLFGEKLKRSRVLQEKYLTYYNLRKSIEDLATHLSLDKLSQMIVFQAFELVKKGDRSLLLLGTADGSEVSVVATRSLDLEAKITYQKGDFFDYWVLKNRQALLLSDIEKDFRFSVSKRSLTYPFESAILAPLFLESSGGGILRINSSKKNVFTVDDLRLLQILSDLASTALINSFLYSKTEELAIRDSLTGLYVHRYFKERLGEECRRIHAHPGHSFSLILLDLDQFKKFNDRQGHPSGDIVLQKIGKLIQEEVGTLGLVARYGGEEFAVILPEARKNVGLKLAESIRKSVEKLPIKIREKVHYLTISGGVAEFPGDAAEEEGLIRLADQYLYQAKSEGRNRICFKTS
jgi:diguanylate cyclase (GGDEF)-like protein